MLKTKVKSFFAQMGLATVDDKAEIVSEIKRLNDNVVNLNHQLLDSVLADTKKLLDTAQNLDIRTQAESQQQKVQMDKLVETCKDIQEKYEAVSRDIRDCSGDIKQHADGQEQRILSGTQNVLNEVRAMDEKIQTESQQQKAQIDNLAEACRDIQEKYEAVSRDIRDCSGDIKQHADGQEQRILSGTQNVLNEVRAMDEKIQTESQQQKAQMDNLADACRDIQEKYEAVSRDIQDCSEDIKKHADGQNQRILSGTQNVLNEVRAMDEKIKTDSQQQKVQMDEMAATCRHMQGQYVNLAANIKGLDERIRKQQNSQNKSSEANQRILRQLEQIDHHLAKFEKNSLKPEDLENIVALLRLLIAGQLVTEVEASLKDTDSVAAAK